MGENELSHRPFSRKDLSNAPCGSADASLRQGSGVLGGLWSGRRGGWRRSRGGRRRRKLNGIVDRDLANLGLGEGKAHNGTRDACADGLVGQCGRGDALTPRGTSSTPSWKRASPRTLSAFATLSRCSRRTRREPTLSIRSNPSPHSLTVAARQRSRVTSTLRIVTSARGFEPSAGTLAMACTTATGEHSPKIV